jgi:ribonuclease HI
MSLVAYTDGACREANPGLCSAAFVVFEDGTEIHSEARYLGKATNNFAEYAGLLDLLRWADGRHTGVTIYSDSQLIVNQSCGNWKVNKKELEPLQRQAYALLIRGGHTLAWVKGHSGNAGNERVDQLCNEVLDKVQKERKASDVETIRNPALAV